jgi:hypothetical protein
MVPPVPLTQTTLSSTTLNPLKEIPVPEWSISICCAKTTTGSRQKISKEKGFTIGMFACFSIQNKTVTGNCFGAIAKISHFDQSIFYLAAAHEKV